MSLICLLIPEPNQRRPFMQFRQGDVFIRRIEKKPSKLQPIQRESGAVVLAHGEVTVHAHKIKSPRAALFHDPVLAATFLHVTGDDSVLLEHEEHSAIELPPGDYEVILQREYSPEEIRTVAD